MQLYAAEKQKDRENDAKDRQFFKKMMAIAMLGNFSNPAAMGLV